jgi:hypothetical protein
MKKLAAAVLARAGLPVSTPAAARAGQPAQAELTL